MLGIYLPLEVSRTLKNEVNHLLLVQSRHVQYVLNDLDLVRYVNKIGLDQS